MTEPEHCTYPHITNPVFSRIDPRRNPRDDPKPFVSDAHIDNVFLVAGRDWDTAPLVVGEHDVSGLVDLMIHGTFDVNAELEMLLEWGEFDLDNFCAVQASRIEHNSLTRKYLFVDLGVTAMTVTSVAAWLLYTYKAASVDKAIEMCGMGDVPPLCRAALERIRTPAREAKYTENCCPDRFGQECEFDPTLVAEDASKVTEQCELPFQAQKQRKRTARPAPRFDEETWPGSASSA
jgi:hypothetical protein